MATNAAQPQPLTFNELAAMAWRRRYATAGAFAIVFVVVLIATARITPLYEATASLSVDRGRQPVPFAVDGAEGTIEFGLLNMQREMLLSAPVLTRALRESPLHDNPIYDASRDPLAALRKRLTVTTNRDSWAIEAALRDEDRDRAQAGLAAVVRAYTEYQLERSSGRTAGAVTFLRDQVEVARKAVDDARAREEAFRREKGIQSTDPDRNQIAMRVQELSTARIELERQRAAAAALATQVRAAQAVAEPDARRGALMRIDAIGRHPAVVELQQRLVAAEADAAQVAEKYLEKHPRAIEAQRRVEVARAQLDDAIAAAAAGTLAEEGALTAQAQELDARIARDEKDLGEYRENLNALQAMTDESKTSQDLFADLLKQLGQEEVASRLAMTDVAVIDPSTAAALPVNIHRGIFAALAMAGGLVAGALAALAMEAFDRRVRGADQAAELSGLPLLGAVPHVAELAPLGRGGDPEKPHAVAEACRALRAALLLTQRREGSRCLAITSTAPGEGKSTLAARLAVSLASTGARVLLVDGDLRKPTLHHQVGEGEERGLSFLLAGYDGVAPAATSYANLDFLGVGVRPPNPAELLHSPALGQLIARSRKQYQFVIVDTPPLAAASDALIVGEQVDGVVMVVRDRVTLKAALRLALRKLSPIASKLIGVVLTDERQGDGAVGYYYAYQYATPEAATNA